MVKIHTIKELTKREPVMISKEDNEKLSIEEKRELLRFKNNYEKKVVNAYKDNYYLSHIPKKRRLYRKNGRGGSLLK